MKTAYLAPEHQGGLGLLIDARAALDRGHIQEAHRLLAEAHGRLSGATASLHIQIEAALDELAGLRTASVRIRQLPWWKAPRYAPQIDPLPGQDPDPLARCWTRRGAERHALRALGHRVTGGVYSYLPDAVARSWDLR